MPNFSVRKRRRLKRKDLQAAVERLRVFAPVPDLDPAVNWEWATSPTGGILLGPGGIMAIEFEDYLFPTVRGILKWGMDRHWVTVDMGAVRFVYNGADVMAPGITAADPEIQAGGPVWIRDENNHRPLAVGIAKVAGPELVGPKGKVIRTVHHVGDEIYRFPEE